MTLTASQATLRTGVRLRSSTVGATVAFPDASIDVYIQHAANQLYDLILSAWGEDYYTTSAAVSIVAGTYSYGVPAAVYKVQGFDVTSSDGLTTNCEPWEFERRNDMSLSGGALRSRPTSFRVVGANIVLMPTPDVSYTGTLWYVPTPPQLSGSIGFDGVAGWEEYIIAKAAMGILLDQERDTSQIASEVAQITERIKRMAPNRTMRAKSIKRVRDTRVQDPREVLLRGRLRGW